MLERYSRLYHAEGRVLFLGTRNDVPRLMPHFDLVWLASGYEGQSNALMEAMAAGVPVVATDIPANRELVVHGESGMLVPLDNRGIREHHSYAIGEARVCAAVRRGGPKADAGRVQRQADGGSLRDVVW